VLASARFCAFPALFIIRPEVIAPPPPPTITQSKVSSNPALIALLNRLEGRGDASLSPAAAALRASHSAAQ
jgi:hypothetical protein